MGKKIYIIRHNKTDNYVANSIGPGRVYTPFLEYAVWFESKENAKKYYLKSSEWIDDGHKWWQKSENEKYEKNRKG